MASTTTTGLLPVATLLLATSGVASATTIYADKSLGADCATAYQPSTRACSGGTAAAYRTLASALNAAQPGDIVLRRFLSVDPSYGAGLFGTLRALRRDGIIAMGVSTNFAVEGTVRGAVNRSLSVVVPEDCCAGVPLEMHRFSVERILSLLATVTTAW